MRFHGVPHPNFSGLQAALRAIASGGAEQKFDGVAYRYTASRYAATRHLLSGEGAFKAGGRWNAPGAFHAVYCASNPELANREYFAGLALAGFAPHAAMPLTGKALRIRLRRVLDLTDSENLEGLAIEVEAIASDRWSEMTDRGEESLCQAIGRAALDAKYQALIVPSAEAKDRNDFNIVLIRENLRDLRGKVWAMRARKRK